MIADDPQTLDTHVHVASDSVSIQLPDSVTPIAFPVTTSSTGGVVRAAMVGEYGPSAGTAPDGHLLRIAALEKWPLASVFERRTTGERGADPRGYDVFYVELHADGTRTDIDSAEVSALFGVRARISGGDLVGP